MIVKTWPLICHICHTPFYFVTKYIIVTLKLPGSINLVQNHTFSFRYTLYKNIISVGSLRSFPRGKVARA